MDANAKFAHMPTGCTSERRKTSKSSKFVLVIIAHGRACAWHRHHRVFVRVACLMCAVCVRMLAAVSLCAVCVWCADGGSVDVPCSANDANPCNGLVFVSPIQWNPICSCVGWWACACHPYACGSVCVSICIGGFVDGKYNIITSMSLRISVCCVSFRFVKLFFFVWLRVCALYSAAVAAY